MQIDIEKILKKHELWLKSFGEQGERANLYRADLSEVNLRGAKTEDGALTFNPISITGLQYSIFITEYRLRIGCKSFTIEEWKLFDDEEINEMDDGALEFSKKYKPMILEIVKTFINNAQSIATA